MRSERKGSTRSSTGTCHFTSRTVDAMAPQREQPITRLTIQTPSRILRQHHPQPLITPAISIAWPTSSNEKPRPSVTSKQQQIRQHSQKQSPHTNAIDKFLASENQSHTASRNSTTRTHPRRKLNQQFNQHLKTNQPSIKQHRSYRKPPNQPRK